jgi:hypothetical protein
VRSNASSWSARYAVSQSPLLVIRDLAGQDHQRSYLSAKAGVGGFPLCANSGHSMNRHTRQNDPDFGELARLGFDLNRPAMLLDDDVVTNRQA